MSTSPVTGTVEPACANCRFWKAYSDAIYGQCRRYPQVIQKEGEELCGEHQFLPPAKPAKRK